MQIKLLLEIQNTSYTNTLLRVENKKRRGGCWSILWVQHIAVLFRCILCFCACVKAANTWLITNQYSAVWDAVGCARHGAFETSATVKANDTCKSFNHIHWETLNLLNKQNSCTQHFTGCSECDAVCALTVCECVHGGRVVKFVRIKGNNGHHHQSLGNKDEV